MILVQLMRKAPTIGVSESHDVKSEKEFVNLASLEKQGAEAFHGKEQRKGLMLNYPTGWSTDVDDVV